MKTLLFSEIGTAPVFVIYTIPVSSDNWLPFGCEFVPYVMILSVDCRGWTVRC